RPAPQWVRSGRRCNGITIAVSGDVRSPSVHPLNGPNVHHHEPVLVATLDLEQLAHTTSAERPSSVDRLIYSLPGLRTHPCGIGYGGRRRLVQAAMADTTSAVAVELAQDKQLTKEVRRTAFVPVPNGRVACDEMDAVRAFRELGGAVVLKPLDGNKGRGISI